MNSCTAFDIFLYLSFHLQMVIYSKGGMKRKDILRCKSDIQLCKIYVYYMFIIHILQQHKCDHGQIYFNAKNLEGMSVK